MNEFLYIRSDMYPHYRKDVREDEEDYRHLNTKSYLLKLSRAAIDRHHMFYVLDRKNRLPLFRVRGKTNCEFE